MLASTVRPQLRTSAAVRPFTASRRPVAPVQARMRGATQLIQSLEKETQKADLPQVRVGDSVKISLAVTEANGKTRTQKLDGVIIGQKGDGNSRTMIVRRIFQGVGIEFCIPVQAPALQKVEVVKHGRVRRSKLYFLRERLGKAARLKEVLDKPAAKAK